MLNPSTRRLLAGLGVVGAFVATSAVPTSAAPTDIEVDYYFADLTVAAGTSGKVESPTMFASEPVVLHEVTMRYDFSDLAGKVTVQEEDDFGYCTKPEPSVLLCTTPFEIGLEDWGIGGNFPVVVAPTDEAETGDTGTLRMTLTAAGLEPVKRESKIRVGEGVDLAAGDETQVSVAPGGKFSLPLAVRNAGTTTVQGSTAVFYGDYAFRAAEKYSNCTYEGDELRTCHFDEALTPGTRYRASLGFVLGADTYAPGRSYADAVWMTSAEYEDFAGYLKNVGVSPGKPGTGGVLPLAGEAGRVRGAQADTDPTNNWASYQVKVTGTNGTDLAAVGDKVTGAAGEEVRASVGFRNNGPATLDYTRSGSSVTYVKVVVPTGTTVVAASEFCAPVKGDDRGEPGEPGGREYLCFPTSLSKAGEEELVEFTLRIDKVVANAKGVVEANVSCQCDGGFNDDLKPANDIAALLVNATTAGGGAGGGEDDGSLPITGARTSLVLAASGLLLVAGVVGLVLARRRRTRFVA
ncbi:LPXTG cell wall anchor domain-containing protein [Micromonospora echinospora]|uniref:LPXTG-motif cell wall anchor domain-containing protein n=1 Tax=Micromonospora echinospora TaxID=1877 RepID=A0A1C4W486_MICEC|nr:LPXTG cell wall anchor domain-containing protein [Micromonospora echinospora]OZV80086.1 LPXTG cell wall anchor domain-containing protein [Micromonospora echinospora]SCE90859.1 LPXTG-motif cell wall anchor domain-containing protein [Micromonospora echinospora]